MTKYSASRRAVDFTLITFAAFQRICSFLATLHYINALNNNNNRIITHHQTGRHLSKASVISVNRMWTIKHIKFTYKRRIHSQIKYQVMKSFVLYAVMETHCIQQKAHHHSYMWKLMKLINFLLAENYKLATRKKNWAIFSKQQSNNINWQVIKHVSISQKYLLMCINMFKAWTCLE